MNEYAAMAWACANQLGRRNLNDFQKADLYTMQYDNDRKARGGQDGNTNAEKRMDKTYPIVSDNEKPLTTIQKIAKEHNVPEGTMKKNIELGHGISKGEEMVPGFRDAILTGKAKASKKTLRDMRLADDEAAKKAAEFILDGEADSAREVLKSEPIAISEEPPRGRTAERLAKEYGVGRRTVNRAADFARGVDIADNFSVLFRIKRGQTGSFADAYKKDCCRAKDTRKNLSKNTKVLPR